MDDDKILKIVLYVMVTLYSVAIIGIWEKVLEPVITFAANNIKIVF